MNWQNQAGQPYQMPQQYGYQQPNYPQNGYQNVQAFGQPLQQAVQQQFGQQFYAQPAAYYPPQMYQSAPQPFQQPEYAPQQMSTTGQVQQVAQRLQRFQQPLQNAAASQQFYQPQQPYQPPQQQFQQTQQIQQIQQTGPALQAAPVPQPQPAMPVPVLPNSQAFAPQSEQVQPVPQVEPTPQLVVEIAPVLPSQPSEPEIQATEQIAEETKVEQQIAAPEPHLPLQKIAAGGVYQVAANISGQFKAAVNVVQPIQNQEIIQPTEPVSAPQLTVAQLPAAMMLRQAPAAIQQFGQAPALMKQVFQVAPVVLDTSAPQVQVVAKPQVDLELVRSSINSIKTSLDKMIKDKDEVIKVAAALTHAERELVAEGYERQYGQSLIRDLQKALSLNLETLIVACFTQKPQMWAERIAAVLKNEKKLFWVVLPLTQHMYALVSHQFYQITGNGDMAEEIARSSQGEVGQLLRQHLRFAQRNMTVEQAVQLLAGATGADAYLEVLSKCSSAVYEQAADQFRRKTGKQLRSQIEEDLGKKATSFLYAHDLLISVASAMSFAIYKAVKGAGTDDESLISVTALFAEQCRGNALQKAFEPYGDVSKALKGDLSGKYLSAVLQLWGLEK